MRRRGFLLVTVLLVMGVLLIAGLALLTKETNSYGEGRVLSQKAQARSLATAGLEDGLAKIQGDIFFPPSQADDQLQLSWSEEVRDFETGQVLGTYKVTYDRTHADEPFSTIILTSTGRLGALGEKPKAIKTLFVEVDVSGTPETNPNHYQVVHFSKD